MKRQFEMYIEKYWGDYVGGTDESLTVPIDGFEAIQRQVFQKEKNFSLKN